MKRFLKLSPAVSLVLMVACGGDSAAPAPTAGAAELTLTAVPKTVDVAALAADIDADGYADLLVLRVPDPAEAGGISSVSVYRGPLSGGSSPAAAEEYAVPAGATSLAVGDVDGDGVKDIVVGYRGGVRLLLRGASGVRQADVLAGLYADAVQVGDVDGDGFPDILASGSGYLFMVRGLGAGVFDEPVHCLLGGPWTVGSFAGNGQAAVAMRNRFDTNAADILGWDSIAGWVAGATVHFSQTITSLSAADVNGDGAIDLVAGLDSSSTGTAFQSAPFTFTAPVEAPGVPNPMSADLNADGAVDQIFCKGRTTVVFAR